MVLNCLGMHISTLVEMLQRFQKICFPFSKNCDGICNGIPSKKRLWRISVATDYRDGKLWPISVTICDGWSLFRHKFPVHHNFSFGCGVPPSKIVIDLPSQFPSQLSTFRHKWIEMEIIPSQIIVTVDFPSQSVVTITFVNNEIVTDYFPSQFPSQFQFFRHKFRHKL